jgi:hypothetical protein
MGFRIITVDPDIMGGVPCIRVAAPMIKLVTLMIFTAIICLPQMTTRSNAPRSLRIRAYSPA